MSVAGRTTSVVVRSGRVVEEGAVDQRRGGGGSWIKTASSRQQSKLRAHNLLNAKSGRELECSRCCIGAKSDIPGRELECSRWGTPQVICQSYIHEEQ